MALVWELRWEKDVWEERNLLLREQHVAAVVRAARPGGVEGPAAAAADAERAQRPVGHAGRAAPRCGAAERVDDGARRHGLLEQPPALGARRARPSAPGAAPPHCPINKLFRAFALRRAGLVSESKDKLQYT